MQLEFQASTLSSCIIFICCEWHHGGIDVDCRDNTIELHIEAATRRGADGRAAAERDRKSSAEEEQ